jgi:Ca2+-transporting ATPase
MIGLKKSDVEKIRETSGFNEITSKNHSEFVEKILFIFHLFTDPMGIMLLGLGTLYWFLGEKNDAIILFVSFIPVSAVDIILEIKAKKALLLLSENLKKTAKVYRDNLIEEINIRELVPDDIIVFEEGQSLPADGIILESLDLNINEAALTGESLPIQKLSNDNFLAGTVILSGTGTGKIQKIGKATQYGKIAKLLESKERETSPLKEKINSIVKIILVIALILACLLFVFTYWRNKDWALSLIQSLTFGMAAIPEEFPLVFTLYLSLGAYRLSKHGVLIKSLPSVETLGSVDVICTDKTGTLTEGTFELEEFDITSQDKLATHAWLLALMACEVKAIDAMELAILKKAESSLQEIEKYQLTWDYPFEQKGKHMSHVWSHNQETQVMFMAMKGSVEGVLEHCLTSSSELMIINEKIKFWASKGKRILAVAGKSAHFSGDRIKDEVELNFIGLLIFSDPIRNSAKIAIKNAQDNEIEIKMLTGDHPLTAHAIAEELEIQHQDHLIFTGNQLSQMNPEERANSYLAGSIFTRVLPEQKYEMVDILKRNGKIVAMTGDGINDAPALKIADIGISMGKNATDVARNSAHMILLNNDFNGITEAIIEGRKVFSNLKKSFSYLISFHFPIVFFAFVPPLFNLGSILLPIHIVLMELVVHPISAFSFENLPDNNNKADRKIMTKRRLFESLLSGLLLSIGAFFLFNFYLKSNGENYARSVAMTSLLLGNIFFVINETYPIRTNRIVIIAFILLGANTAILKIDFLSRLFHLTSIGLIEFLLCLAIGFLATLPSFLLRNFKKTATSSIAAF